jgi:hypothetical protein
MQPLVVIHAIAIGLYVAVALLLLGHYSGAAHGRGGAGGGPGHYVARFRPALYRGAGDRRGAARLALRRVPGDQTYCGMTTA